MRADTDFQAVFAQMGESFSKGEPAVETSAPSGTGSSPTEETDGASEQAESQDPGRKPPQQSQRKEGEEPRGGSFIAQADSG